MRNITIDFDLNAKFDIDNGVDLKGATINAQKTNNDLSNYITAFRCFRIGSAEDSSKLASNKELSVCIKSTSPEVDIDKIVSMVSASTSLVCN